MAEYLISADRIAEAERLVYKAWTAGGQENGLLEQAGRILYEEYMAAGEIIDEVWRCHPSPYDPEYDRNMDMFVKLCIKYGMDRKKTAGLHYTSREKLCGMPTEALVERIKGREEWDLGELRELCRRAGMLEEWICAGCDSFEDVAGRAAAKLGVDIGETGVPGTPNLSVRDIVDACASVMAPHTFDNPR